MNNKFYREILVVFFLFLSLSSAGCGSIQFNKEQASLMPEAVALDIFREHDLGAWASSPYVGNGGVFCNDKKRYISFSDIDDASYNRTARLLWFRASNIKPNEGGGFCPSYSVHFRNISEEQAKELTLAACALGANITNLTWVY